MTGSGKRRILFLLIAAACMVLLSGCPRRITKEEEEQLLSSGHAMLTQAMKEDYQLEEGDFQIVSRKIFLGSAYGYEAIKYELEAGDRMFQVTVNLGFEKVFSDYYGKEFEEALTAYLSEKLESIPRFEEASAQLLSVVFYQEGTDEASWGMIPSSISPEEFGSYLEERERDKQLTVTATMAWCSADPEDTLEELRTFLVQEEGGLPASLTVMQFAHPMDEELCPTDLLKCVDFYHSVGDGSIKQYFTTYEYVEVDENLIVRRVRYGDTAWKNEGMQSFKVKVDVNGNLSFYPEDGSYDLFYKGGTEGTYLKCLKDDNRLYRLMLEKAPFCENWCIINGIKGDWSILIEHVMQK